MERIRRQIARSRRLGRIALAAAAFVSLLLGFTLLDALLVALRTGHRPVALRASGGLVVLIVALAVVVVLARRQKRTLDAADAHFDAIGEHWRESFGREEPDD